MTTQALQDNALFQTGYLVNGEWITLTTTFDVLNPATGEVIAKVAKAGKKETEDAIAAATRAFPAWRAKTAKERSTILYRWYELIIENKSWLGRLMTTEQGKPLNGRTVRLSRRSNPARAFWLPVNLSVWWRRLRPGTSRWRC